MPIGVEAVKGRLLVVVGFSVAPPITFFFLRAALGAAILDLSWPCPLCIVCCFSVVSPLVLAADGLELLLVIEVIVVKRETGCFSSEGLLNPFLMEGLEVAFGFMSRELGACSLEAAPGACKRQLMDKSYMYLFFINSYFWESCCWFWREKRWLDVGPVPTITIKLWHTIVNLILRMLKK